MAKIFKWPILLIGISLVFVALAADGSGTNTIPPTSVLTDSTGNTFTFTFTAAETMNSGEISINVPLGWSVPQSSSGTAGFTTANSSAGTIADVKDNANSATGWSAGTACTNGISADSTTKQEGSSSIQCSNGNEATNDRWYKNIAVENWSGYTKIAFWLRSSVAITAGRLNFAYDDSANLASPLEEISVGAISANTWTYVILTFGATTRTSVVSFGLIIKHPSALDNSTIWVDDILIGPGSPAFPGGNDIRVRLLQLANTQTVTVTYGSGGGASGAVAPSTAGTYTFTTKSRASDAGTLTNIASSPTVTVNNPAPATTSIAPSSKTVGDLGFTMTVNGSNFVSSSVVRFNGSDRSTTFINSTQLTAAILTSDLTAVGTFSITVFNPAPGGGASNAQNFTVTSAPDSTPPTSPSNLSANAASSSQINLAWTASIDNVGVTEYRIERCQGAGCTNFSQIATVTGAPPLTSYSDTGLAPNTSFSYRVRAADAALNLSGYSGVSSATTLSSGDTIPPSAITDLALSDATSNSIKLTWTAPGDDGNVGTATSYDIRYSTSAINGGNFSTATQVAGEPAPQTAGTLQTMTVTGLSPDTAYFFAMKTSDEVPNTSGLSNVPSLNTLSEIVSQINVPSARSGGGVLPTRIFFAGRAYPGGKVRFFRRSLLDTVTRNTYVLDTEVWVDNQGIFEKEFIALLQGEYFFAVEAKDRDGRSSGISGFTVNLLSSNELVAKNIFVPPTLGFYPQRVVKGKELKIFGYASPDSSIKIRMDDFIERSATSSADGSYSLVFDTGDLEIGNHLVKAAQIDADGRQSDFSPVKSFQVSLPPLQEADFNQDGIINITDWSVFLFRWQSQDSVLRKTIDLDKDGRVDISDFSLFLKALK